MNIRSIAVIVIVGALAGSVHAQNIAASFGGIKNATDFAYGLTSGIPALNVAPGSTNGTTGSSTITLNTGVVSPSNQQPFSPITTNTPITIGFGGNQETVTPTGVSGCGAGQPLGACQVTAAFTLVHGPNEPVTTGTYGLQEAINSAFSAGGGIVAVSSGWVSLGGTSAIITAASAYPTVYLINNAGATLTLAPYYTMQRTTLTVVGVPATLTAASVVFTSATGTWASSSTHFTRTFVDCMGQESGPSVDYTQTPTVNYTLTVSAPAQPSTGGACGWLMYAGTSSQAVSYRLPATATTCPGGLTTEETVIPACAMSSAGIWSTAFTTTAPQTPVATGVTNTINPVPQSASTYGYQPSGVPGFGFPISYGPFGAAAVSSATASDKTPLGSVNLPVGFLNYIGRKVRFTGKIQGADTATGTLAIIGGLTWSGAGITAGAPIPVCDTVSASVLGTQTYSFHEDCTFVTNAVSATDAATIQPDSFFLAGGTAGTTNVLATEFNQTAVTTLNLAQSDVFTVYIIPLVEAVTTVQLMDLNIEVLQ